MMEKIALTPEHFWDKRTTKEVYRKKQELVQLLCFYYDVAQQRKQKFGSAEFQISLLSLRSLVRDYQPAFNFFFEVVKKGYRFSSDEKELTTVVPKKLDFEIENNYKFEPEEMPNGGVISKVNILQDPNLVRDVIKAGLFQLIPKIEFLQSCANPINFVFMPAGELGLRDTSVWPIPAIETWPSWVRTRLFGHGIDIKSAYVQFVVEAISQNYEIRSRLLFDKIFVLWENPSSIRRQISTILGVDYEQHKKDIKGLLMAVAMGSKVSPTIVFHDVSYSRCSTLINRIQPNITEQQANQICDLLTPLTMQFKFAKKTLPIDMGKYFSWERERRYLLWELVGRHGIMMHDGIDGIPIEIIQEVSQMDLGFQISHN